MRWLAKRSAALALLFALAGCSRPAPPRATVAPVIVASTLRPGDFCQITLALPSQPRNGEMIYRGKVVDINADEVVLKNASLNLRSEQDAPVLQHVPYIGRHFKSVGVARQEVGTVRLALDRVLSFHVEDAPLAEGGFERVGVDFN
jgi:hypothetical protein